MNRVTRQANRDRIRALSDADLTTLAGNLATEAATKQSLLATARREMKRRARAVRTAA